MPSNALRNWRRGGKQALDEIEAAHAAIGGSGPGRRYATQQINQAYAVMLSSQFQASSAGERRCAWNGSEVGELHAPFWQFGSMASLPTIYRV